MLRIEFEQEDDGRWIAEIPALPGVMAYGATQNEAKANVEALALRTFADRPHLEAAYREMAADEAREAEAEEWAEVLAADIDA